VTIFESIKWMPLFLIIAGIFLLGWGLTEATIRLNWFRRIKPWQFITIGSILAAVGIIFNLGPGGWCTIIGGFLVGWGMQRRKPASVKEAKDET
jgi:hypothetical protein